MPKNSGNDVYTRVITMIKAWKLLRPNKSFASFTLEGFEKAVAPSLNARKEVEIRDAALREAMELRDDADVHTRKVLIRVAGAVVADAEEGEDGELYSAMGYVPRAVRSSMQSVGRVRAAQQTDK
jgi:hypothetical protein